VKRTESQWRLEPQRSDLTASFSCFFRRTHGCSMDSILASAPTKLNRFRYAGDQNVLMYGFWQAPNVKGFDLQL